MLYEITQETPGYLEDNSLSTYLISEPRSSEKLLWQAFKRGDEGAFEEIYVTYANELYQQGCRFTDDKEMVRDCLHDFFIYLNKNRSGFGETTSIKLYLLKSFKRRIVEYLQKKKHECNLNESSAESAQAVELSIETAYIIGEMNLAHIKKLNEALKTLDSKERKAIYYFYFKGLSYEQIARLFNFSHVSSARRVMYRSLQHLRHYFIYS